MILALIYLILAVTFWLGREGHDEDSESMNTRIETSESNPFSIDFIDFSVAMGNSRFGKMQEC